MMLTAYLFYSFFGYLSGSVLYSYLIPKYFCHVDVRTVNEDQNPGAFNAFSVAGPRIGLLCVLCDIGKGFLPVFLAVYYLMPERLRNGVLALGFRWVPGFSP
jgi:glycerol-3-phosphate acyltransferase PlsY